MSVPRCKSGATSRTAQVLVGVVQVRCGQGDGGLLYRASQVDELLKKKRAEEVSVVSREWLSCEQERMPQCPLLPTNFLYPVPQFTCDTSFITLLAVTA